MGKGIYLFLVLIMFSNILFTGCERSKNFEAEPVGIEETVEIVKTEESKKLSISVVGDILMDGSVKTQINNNGYDYPWEHVYKYFQEDDITIGNLETSITTKGIKWPDKQYNFRSDPKNLEALEMAGIDVVSLANNHSLDYGYEGLLDTLNYIDKSGIHRVGAGKDYNDAIKETIIEKNGYKIGILGFSRVVPSVDWYAINNRPGLIGAYDSQLKIVLEEVEALNKEVDILILSVHWGTERQTTPREIDVIAAKKLVDAGADVIMGHHPHILQGVEIYNGKPIFYSLGNFVFGTGAGLTSSTMIGQINFIDDKIKSLKLIPCTIVGARPIPVTEKQRSKEIQYINELSKSWGIIFNIDGTLNLD